jgi:hypothetical protein
MRVEIERITGHLLWKKIRPVSEEIDLQGLSDDYWSSTEHEFIMPSQSQWPTDPLMSDREGQGLLTLESIVYL